jgi:hypothetical protein
MAFEDVWNKAIEEYGYIDLIFSTEPELRKLIETAVKEKWTNNRFRNSFSGTQWFQKNSSSIQARGFYQRQYDELVKAGKDTSGTEYARGLDTTKASLERSLTDRGITYDATQLDSWAKELYNSANENNKAYVDRWLNTRISFTPGKEKGDVATNAADLRSYSNKQGFNFDTDFGTAKVTGWMQRLDRGESQEAIKREIEMQAMIGQPESVKALMKQGLTLQDVYTPYTNSFSKKLGKTNANWRDPWISQNILNDKGELVTNWEFEKKLTRHPDYEFGEEANDLAYKNILQIKRDFGLEG